MNAGLAEMKRRGEEVMKRGGPTRVFPNSAVFCVCTAYLFVFFTSSLLHLFTSIPFHT